MGGTPGTRSSSLPDTIPAGQRGFCTGGFRPPHQLFAELDEFPRRLHPYPLVAARDAARAQGAVHLTQPAPNPIWCHHADRVVQFLNPADDREVAVAASEIGDIVCHLRWGDAIAGGLLGV